MSGRVRSARWVGMLAGLLGAMLAAVPACSSGVAVSTGLYTEPIQVVGGQFFSGALPVGSAAADGSDATGPVITELPAIGSSPLPVYNGQAGVGISGGYTTPDAASVAVRFTDLGTGYWIVPVGPIDAAMNGDRSFSMKVNFAPSVPGGHHTLEVSALDAAGNAGPLITLDVCVTPSVPDYTTSPATSHTCRPSSPLPALVISMKWDVNLDLDLTVIFPDGTNHNPKDPNAEEADGGEGGAAAAFFDRDSLRNCYDDGYRQEDLIFPDTPTPGTYLIYANPFQSCGQPSTTFSASVYKAQGVCPTCGQVVEFTQAGQVLGSTSFGNQTTGGSSLGLYVGAYTYP
jgi:hypothetical protein